MKDGYTYDHLIKRLLNEAGWPRVPLFVSGPDTPPTNKLMAKVKELELKLGNEG